MMSLAYIGLASLVTLGSLKMADNYRQEHYAQHIFSQKALTGPITPENTVFVFDMHKVFMKQDALYSGIFKRHWQPMSKLLLYPSTYSNVRTLVKETKIIERIGERLEGLYPQLDGLSLTIQDIFVKQAFMPDTLAIIQQLKSKGYKIYVLSNCAEETYKILETTYPEVFTLFNGYYVPSAENKYDFKPRPSFYKGCKTYLAGQGHHDKTPVFIDDRKRNILSSLPEDFVGIHFTSATQLKKDVQRLEQDNSKEITPIIVNL